MNRFAGKLLKRNWGKRLIVLAAALVGLLLLTAVLTPLLLHRQLSAALDAATAEESTGSANTAGTETAGDADGTGTVPTHKKEGDAHKVKAILRALPEVSIAAKIILPLLAVAVAAVAVLLRVTEAEWLWREAVTHRMNRALWPILGAFFGVFAVLVLLIVVNDPKRMAKQA